jgi:hypothetical protein
VLELGLRRTDDVATPRRAQPRQVLRARHATIGNPHAPYGTVPVLHGLHDLLQRGRIMGIAGKHFVTQRKAIKAHDQRDAHLFAIGAVIA